MMHNKIVVINIDQQFCSAMGLDQNLTVVAKESQPLKQTHPQPAWSEQDALEIWEAARDVSQSVVQQIGADQVGCIAITSSPGGALVWDRQTSQAVYPIITWTDRRTESYCWEKKETRKEPMLHFRTGLFLEPFFAAPKISWVLDHCDDGWAKAKKGELAFGNTASWILWQLTRGQSHYMDSAAASQTLLFDLNSLKWETQLLAAFDIPAPILPKVTQSADYFGSTDSKLFGRSIPVMSLIGHGSAEMFAWDLQRAEDAHVHMGRTLDVQVWRGYAPTIQSKLMSSVAWTLDNRTHYKWGSHLNSSGLLIDWLIDNMGVASDYRELSKLAGTVSDTEGVTLIPAFHGLGAPYFDPHGRGMLVGLHTQTSKAHLARSAMDAICHQSIDVIRFLEKSTKRKVETIALDGCYAKNELIQQLLADLSGVPVRCNASEDQAVIGAAFMSAFKTGMLETKEPLADRITASQKTVHPKMEARERIRKRQLWLDAYEKARGWNKS